MMEQLFEFSLCVIDGFCLLYFYFLLIHQKCSWKRMLFYVLLYSFIQYGKDFFLDFGKFSFGLDILIVVIFLQFVTEVRSLLKLQASLIIYSTFSFSLIFFVSVAQELSLDMQSTLVFGLSRVVFSAFLKIFIAFILYVLVKPLGKLQNILPYGEMNLFNTILITSTFGLSYIYGGSVGNDKTFMYILFLTIVLLLMFALYYKHCDVSKKYEDSKMVNRVMELTLNQVKGIESEYEHYRKLKHDLNNQIMVLYELQKEKQYAEVEKLLEKLSDGLILSKSSLTGNLYIDAVLRQKMAQYDTITFHNQFIMSKEFEFNSNDLVSLLSNIIDNACEELLRINETDFYLYMNSQVTFQIVAKNKMSSKHDLKTQKDKRFHGFGLKIIEDIVQKNEGEMELHTGEEFCINIVIPL